MKLVVFSRMWCATSGLSYISRKKRSIPTRSDAASKNHAPTVSLTAARATPASPTTVATAASGTTARFATMPITETWLKWTSAIGSTASCAATLTPSAPVTTPRGSGASTILAVAANESWNPGSWRSPGSTASSASAASARLLSTDASRSISSAPSTITAMTTARSTEGWGPTMAANATTAPMAPVAAIRALARVASASAKIADATRATLNPETASTWYTPASRNDCTTAGGSCPRAPRSSPPSSAADTGGNAASITASARRRSLDQDVVRHGAARSALGARGYGLAAG